MARYAHSAVRVATPRNTWPVSHRGSTDPPSPEGRTGRARRRRADPAAPTAAPRARPRSVRQGQGDREGAGLPRDDGPDGVTEAEDDEAPRGGELARSVKQESGPAREEDVLLAVDLGRPSRTDQAAIGKSSPPSGRCRRRDAEALPAASAARGSPSHVGSGARRRACRQPSSAGPSRLSASA